jgi:hypothetical protein
MSKKKPSKQTSEAISILKSYKERPFIKHQWEELVQQLSQMNDPQLREIANREMNTIHENNDWFIKLKSESRLAHSTKMI